MVPKMFHGTQHVPRQISETFMLARRVHAIASRYFSDDANPAVVSTFEKLAGNVPQENVRVLEDNVTGLGSGKPATLTASQVLAVMQLTNLPVHNRSAIIFHRFLPTTNFTQVRVTNGQLDIIIMLSVLSNKNTNRAI